MPQSSSPVVIAGKYKRKKLIQDYLLAIAFILPTLIILVTLVIIPIFNTAFISFFKWDGVNPVKEYVGIKNYTAVLVDPIFFTAIKNNIIWTVFHTVFACGMGLFVAFQLVRVKVFQKFFRVVLFLPNVIALSISALIWTMIYNPSFGILNGLLKAVGLGALIQQWTGNYKIAIYSLSVANSWQAYGYYMILFMAGLQNIDETLYEAARIDGAGAFKQFMNVTIPGLKNVLTFVLSISIINGLKGFATVWTMTQGGPAGSTMLLALYVYIKAFQESRFGLGCTAGVLLGITIIIITIIFNKIRDRVNE
jgi:raffinose/stachyose/melibiose transport system permease protein